MSYLLILNVPPPYGGGEIRANLLYNYFKRKNNYHILAIRNHKRNKKSQGKLSNQNIIHNINYIKSSLSYIIKYKPSTVYISIPKSFLPLIKIIPLLFLKYIYNYRLHGELAGSHFYFLNSNFIFSFIGKSILRNFTSIRVLGKKTKADLAQHNIRNTHVMDNGIKVPIKDNKCRIFLPQKEINLLYVGAINKSKGIFTLYEIAKLLKHNNINFNFDILGEWSNYNDKKLFSELILSKNLHNNFSFHGVITGDEKWKFYDNADLFIFPSYNEGQPLTILEALAHGLPIISSDVGLIPETISDGINGFIVTDQKANSYFDYIIKLIMNKTLYHEISHNNIILFKNRFTHTTYLNNFELWITGR